MNAVQSLHPTDQTLSSFALGKLDDHSVEAVNAHLMECSDCRKRVAEMSADSFLQRVRDAQTPSEESRSNQPQAGGTPGDRAANTLTSNSDDSLPPGLAVHPDYEVKRELGRGGMGVVYLAHNKLLGRDEVLKVMGQHLVDHSGVLERFLREMQSVARLRHPNIVTAYHATRLGQGIVFSMEYVEGLDLSKLVKAKGPMPVAHACLFIHQAALGLQHAHEEGLVHRDIKPHNLMLSRKGNKATVKILDFGLAKAVCEEKVQNGLTAKGQAIGTPDYIAPEQITDAPTADIRADIYSLGGTLYYLLTGRPPFQAKSLYDLYQAHISRDADPLNHVRADVPAELAALVAKMMAKDPAQRFQTPGEVAQALKPFCTTANAALKIVKADVAQTEPANADRPAVAAASAAIPMETDDDRRMGRTNKATQCSDTESRWENFIDFRATEREMEAASDAAPTRWPKWIWPSTALAALMLALFAAGMAVVIKVLTPDGVIILENVPKDSEILVDGNKFTFTWPGGEKPVEVRAVPGQHRVEVRKDGFKTFGEVVSIQTDQSEEVIVRLEPLVVIRPEPKKEDTLEPEADRRPEPKSGVVAPRTTDNAVTSATEIESASPKGSVDSPQPSTDKPPVPPSDRFRNTASKELNGINGSGRQPVRGNMTVSVRDGSGFVYELDADRTVYRINGGNGRQQARDNVTALKRDRSGFVYVLDSERNVYRINGAGMWQNTVSNVTALAADGSGLVYELDTDRTVYRNDGSGWQRLRSNVTALAADGSGFVYELDADRTVYRTNGGSVWQKGRSDVTALAADRRGFVYALDANQTVCRIKGSSGWQKVRGSMSALVADGSGFVYGLDPTGIVSRRCGDPDWEQVHGSMTALVADGSGFVYGLDPTGIVSRRCGNSDWQHFRANITALVADGSGFVYGLDATGIVSRRCGNSDWPAPPGGATSLASDASGFVYELDAKGNVYRQCGNFAWQLGLSSVAKVVTSSGGFVYALRSKSGTLYRCAGGDWKVYARGVQSLSGSPLARATWTDVSRVENVLP